jgi:hypothetical protein
VFPASTSERDHAVLVSLCQAYFTYHNDLQFHPCWHKWQDFIFYSWIASHCARVIFSSSVHPLMDSPLFPYLGYCESCCNKQLIVSDIVLGSR